MNFSTKNMKMIINVSKTLKYQNFRFRFSVAALCIFNSYDPKISMLHQVC